MVIEERMRHKLHTQLQPLHLEVVNESASHGRPPGTESHFRVLVVASVFEGKSLLAQQRLVYNVLQEELAHDVHALSLKTQTPSQWQTDTADFSSPACRGGSKPL